MFDAASLLSRLKQKVQRRPVAEDDAFDAVETLDVDTLAPADAAATKPVPAKPASAAAPPEPQPVAANPAVARRPPVDEPVFLPVAEHPVLDIAPQDVDEPIGATDPLVTASTGAVDRDAGGAAFGPAGPQDLDVLAPELAAAWTDLDFAPELEAVELVEPVAEVAADSIELAAADVTEPALALLTPPAPAPALMVPGPIWPGPDDPTSLRFGAPHLGDPPVFPQMLGASGQALRKASLLQPLTGHLAIASAQQTAPAADQQQAEPAPVVEPVVQHLVEPAPVVEPVVQHLVEPAPVVEPVVQHLPEPEPYAEPAVVPLIAAEPVAEPVAEHPDPIVTEVLAATTDAWRAAPADAEPVSELADLPEFSIDFEAADIPVLQTPIAPAAVGADVHALADAPIPSLVLSDLSAPEVTEIASPRLADSVAAPVSEQVAEPVAEQGEPMTTPTLAPLPALPEAVSTQREAPIRVIDAPPQPRSMAQRAQAPDDEGGAVDGHDNDERAFEPAIAPMPAAEVAQAVKLHPLERKAALAALPQFIGVSAPLLLIAAMVMAVLFSKQLATTISVFKQSNVAQPGVSYDVAKQPLATPSARRIATIMANNHPAVEVVPNKTGDGVVIMVKNAEAYPQWLYALQSLQGYQKNLVWEARDLCIGSCEGNAARADVRGYTQSFEEKSTEKK